MKIIINLLIALFFIVSANAANPLLPFGPPLEHKGDVVTVGVAITKTDTAWKPIGYTYVFSGNVHKSIDGTKASIYADRFIGRAVAEDNAIVTKLRNIPALKKGDFSVYFADKGFTNYKISLNKSSAILEIYTTNDIPVIEQSQFVVAPFDMNGDDVVKLLEKHTESHVSIKLHDLTM